MYLEKYQADDVLFDFDCTDLLAADETLTMVDGVTQWPTFSGGSPSLLTFGPPVINNIVINYPDGRVMQIGKGFQMKIAGGDPASAMLQRMYSVLATVTTTRTNVMTVKALLAVLPPGFTS